MGSNKLAAVFQATLAADPLVKLDAIMKDYFDERKEIEKRIHVAKLKSKDLEWCQKELLLPRREAEVLLTLCEGDREKAFQYWLDKPFSFKYKDDLLLNKEEDQCK